MDHEYCKQHPRPMPALAMAVTCFQREPNTGDLSRTVLRFPFEASAEKTPL
jgi:hypothetical protein